MSPYAHYNYDRVAEMLAVPRDLVKLRLHAMVYSAARVYPFDNAIAGIYGMTMWPTERGQVNGDVHDG
jgi:hypothetical protein